MLLIAIDPSLVAVQGDNSNAAQAEILLRRIFSLYRLTLNAPWVTVCVPTRAASLLNRLGLYPSHIPVREFLLSHPEIQQYDSGSILKAINHLLSRAAKMEELLPVSDVLFEEWKCEPPESVNASSPDLVNSTQRLLTLLALSNTLSPPSAKITFAALPKVERDCTCVDVRARILLTDPENVVPGHLPINVVSRVLTFFDTDCFLQGLDPDCVWNFAKDGFSIRMAIELLSKRLVLVGQIA